MRAARIERLDGPMLDGPAGLQEAGAAVARLGGRSVLGKLVVTP